MKNSGVFSRRVSKTGLLEAHSSKGSGDLRMSDDSALRIAAFEHSPSKVPRHEPPDPAKRRGNGGFGKRREPCFLGMNGFNP